MQWLLQYVLTFISVCEGHILLLIILCYKTFFFLRCQSLDLSLETFYHYIREYLSGRICQGRYTRMIFYYFTLMKTSKYLQFASLWLRSWKEKNKQNKTKKNMSLNLKVLI